MSLVSEYGGTVFVGVVLLLIIRWAFRELRAKKVQCMSCPIHEHCRSKTCKK